jgi:hypothetical protein
MLFAKEHFQGHGKNYQLYGMDAPAGYAIIYIFPVSLFNKPD